MPSSVVLLRADLVRTDAARFSCWLQLPFLTRRLPKRPFIKDLHGVNIQEDGIFLSNFIYYISSRIYRVLTMMYKVQNHRVLGLM
jgi:hypothetical protein